MERRFLGRGISAGEAGYYMAAALEQAQFAARNDEVPVGALWTNLRGGVVACRNGIRSSHDPTAHAELLCVREASQLLGNERIGGILFTTLEPCPMCMGALLLARVDVVIFAASDPKSGACQSVLSLCSHPSLNHRIDIIQGVCEKESAELLRTFFQKKRRERKYLE